MINALVDSWRGNAAIAALNCEVHDGPYVTDNTHPYRLFVGDRGMGEEGDTQVQAIQHSPHANDVARDEQITIPCSAWYADGEVDMREARKRARELLDLAVTMPRGTQDLGAPNVFYVGFDNIALDQDQTVDGAAAVFAFDVVIRCRIYS